MSHHGSEADELTSAALRETLEHVLHDLRKLHARLVSPHIRRQLAACLHDSEKLPDRRVASLADEAIDVLYSTDRLLQPGYLILADHFLGYANTKCLVAAVQQNVPEILASGPKTIQDLAVAAGARADRLRQIMQTLRNDGIFGYDEATGSYSNNHVSELLRSDHWTGWRHWVDLYGNQFYDMARGIPESIKAGAPCSAAQYAFDTEMDMFAYFDHKGWLPQLHRTLGAGALAQAPGIVSDYPWAEVSDGTVIDIGGGGGALIAALLRANPSMRGGLFDLPSVIEHVRPFFQPGGQFGDVADRVDESDLRAGDFFVEVPENEVYVIQWCLHDWLDDDATKILRSIRKAIRRTDKSRLVVLESVLKDGSAGRLSQYGDINMMITAKGRERSVEDWRKLASASGWTIEVIHPIRRSWVAAIDMRPS